MSYAVEQISAFQKRISFTIPSDEVTKRINDAFRDVSKKARFNGFRPGKAPRSLIESKFGKQIRSDVANEIMEFNFRQAAQDLAILGQPEVQKGDLKENSDFSFAIVVQVKPETRVEGYQGISVKFPVRQVEEAEIDRAIEQRLKSQARLVEVTEDRPVAEGDLALCEISLVEDGEGKVIEAGTLVNTAGDRYYPGVESLVIGASKGEVKSGQVHIGANSQLASMKDRDLELQVKILGIQSSETPALSDDVATQLGYEGGADAMRVALRMEAEGRENEAARNLARVEILQKLIAQNPVEVPPAMVDSHTNLLIEEMRVQSTWRGKDPRTVRFSEAQLADLRRRGEFAAKAAVLLDGIAGAEGIEVTDGDLDAKYQEIADARNQRVEAVRGYFIKENAVEELRTRLLQDRTLEWLFEQAELVTEDAPSADVSAGAENASGDADGMDVGNPAPSDGGDAGGADSGSSDSGSSDSGPEASK